MSLGKGFPNLREKAGSIGDQLPSEAIPCNRRKETAATTLRNIKLKLPRLFIIVRYKPDFI